MLSLIQRVSVTVNVTKVFIMCFLLKDRGSAVQSHLHVFSEAPIKQNSFKTAFERCCRRLVEFDVKCQSAKSQFFTSSSR